MSDRVVMIMVVQRRGSPLVLHVAHPLLDVSINGARTLARAVRAIAAQHSPYPVDLRTAGIVRQADLLSWAEGRNAYVDVSALMEGWS